MRKFAGFIVGASLFLASCQSDKLKGVDVSSVQVPATDLLRLDNDIFSTPPRLFESTAPLWQKKYGTFYNSFMYHIINHGEEHDSIYKALKNFVQDAYIKDVYLQSQKIYTEKEVKQIEQQLTDAFKHIKYHLPQLPLPKQYVCFISGWNYNITTIDSTLGISWDMYLGGDNKYYKMLQYPKYKTRFMSKEYVVSDAIKGWLIHCYDKNEQLNNLLNHMIFYGKLYYALDAALPNTADSIKIQYTGVQMQYCHKYAKNIWAYFTEKNRLYNTDLKELSPYISDGPFTSSISKECPPRIAAYVGWQIVRSYMNKNEKINVEQLMSTDAQIILAQSKYKP
ncbi:MAG: hypothetical protein JST67_05370 [Bacteroidetes bacterium]|nr:hypothetical protein [Bacteroidota bacterium]